MYFFFTLYHSKLTKQDLPSTTLECNYLLLLLHSIFVDSLCMYVLIYITSFQVNKTRCYHQNSGMQLFIAVIA